jgi:hypothetical protein
MCVCVLEMMWVERPIPLRYTHGRIEREPMLVARFVFVPLVVEKPFRQQQPKPLRRE